MNKALAAVKAGLELALIEVKCALGARADLGRPTTTPQENKAAFMAWLEAKPAPEPVPGPARPGKVKYSPLST